jgi:hypothetical protein
MRFSAIILCASGLALAGCDRHRTSDLASESWLSGPQLESRLRPIAEAYAKQHGITYDFSGKHCRLQIDTGCYLGVSPISGDVFFGNGIGKLGFEMEIDRSGRVVRAWTVVPEIGGQPPPGGQSPPNKHMQPIPR